MTSENEALIEEAVTKKVEAMVNPIIEQLKAKLNTPGLTPLRPPPPSERGMIGAQPPLLSSPRPMLPPPPQPLPIPAARGVVPCASSPERPKTLYALELEERARTYARPRMCVECGGTKMVKIKKNAKREIIEYHACPKCVDCVATEI